MIVSELIEELLKCDPTADIINADGDQIRLCFTPDNQNLTYKDGTPCVEVILT